VSSILKNYSDPKGNTFEDGFSALALKVHITHILKKLNPPQRDQDSLNQVLVMIKDAEKLVDSVCEDNRLHGSDNVKLLEAIDLMLGAGMQYCAVVGWSDFPKGKGKAAAKEWEFIKGAYLDLLKTGPKPRQKDAIELGKQRFEKETGHKPRALAYDRHFKKQVIEKIHV
jgi:hypothetical protein